MNGADRPFATELWAAAQELAAKYHVILHDEQGHWFGRGLELPHVYGDGKTADACMADTRTALSGAVAHLLEQGGKPPAPATVGIRNKQVNVRLTDDEKVLLETTARRKGYQGLSDFLRAVALEECSS